MNNGQEGVLITFEGIGGSGKSSVVTRVREWLNSIGIKAVHTREPGGTSLGDTLRVVVTSKREGPAPTPWTEAFLFEADRAQTFAEVIFPALQEGRVVLSDRGEYGTVAYQGYGRGLPLDAIDQMTALATAQRRPDLALVLDLPVDLAMTRRHQVLTDDRFDHEARAFQERVRQGYLFSAERDGPRARVVDASRPTDEVFSEIQTLILEVLRSQSSLPATLERGGE